MKPKALVAYGLYFGTPYTLRQYLMRNMTTPGMLIFWTDPNDIFMIFVTLL